MKKKIISMFLIAMISIGFSISADAMKSRVCGKPYIHEKWVEDPESLRMWEGFKCDITVSGALAVLNYCKGFEDFDTSRCHSKATAKLEKEKPTKNDARAAENIISRWKGLKGQWDH